MFSYRVYGQLLPAALLGSVLCPGAAAQQPPPRSARAAVPPDCFLPRPAATPAELLAQVRADPALRARYARFFHVPDASVPGFLRANLRPARVPKTAKYTVFYVRATGTIYPTLKTLPAATPIYVRPDGQPFLEAATGNPLRPYRIAEEIILVAPPASAQAPRTVEKMIPTQDIPIIQPVTAPAPVFQSPARIKTPAAPLQPVP